MKKYKISLGININIDYGYDDDYIEAEDEEEAKKIAKWKAMKAMEGIEVNTASFSGNDIHVCFVEEEKGTEEE